MKRTLYGILALTIHCGCEQDTEFRSSVSNRQGPLDSEQQASSGEAGQTSKIDGLEKLEVHPRLSSVPVGVNTVFDVTAIYDNGQTETVTDKVSWATSDPAIASADRETPGKIKANAEGETRVYASLGQKKATGQLVVSPITLVGVEIQSDANAFPAGTRMSLRALGRFSDNTKSDVTALGEWFSDNDTIIAVEDGDANGRHVRGLSIGKATIRVLVNGIGARIELEVGAEILEALRVIATPSELPLGTSGTLKAIGDYSDGQSRDVTSSVDWESENSNVVSVGNGGGTPKGRVQTIGRGTATVRANLDNISNTTQILVTAAILESILVEPLNDVAIGDTQEAKAWGKYTNRSKADIDITTSVTWSSKNPAIAAVSNADGSRGVVQGLGTTPTDSVGIVASLGGQQGMTVIKVLPPRLS